MRPLISVFFCHPKTRTPKPGDIAPPSFRVVTMDTVLAVLPLGGGTGGCSCRVQVVALVAALVPAASVPPASVPAASGTFAAFAAARLAFAAGHWRVDSAACAELS